MRDKSRWMAESVANLIYRECDDVMESAPVVHHGDSRDRNSPVNDIFQAAELSVDRAAFEFEWERVNYRVLVYKVEE